MQLVRDGCRAVHSVVFKVHGRLPGLPIPATDPNLTLSVSQEPTLLRMKRTYRLQRVFGYLRS